MVTTYAFEALTNNGRSVTGRFQLYSASLIYHADEIYEISLDNHDQFNADLLTFPLDISHIMIISTGSFTARLKLIVLSAAETPISEFILKEFTVTNINSQYQVFEEYKGEGFPAVKTQWDSTNTYIVMQVIEVVPTANFGIAVVLKSPK